ncbi:hypothetical protein [Methylobacterium sp. 1030]|uniref:hypothetical protein n=1 Tax=Methylobacterium sp. 1030 TaxID=3156404 RepID=UPI00339AC8D4
MTSVVDADKLVRDMSNAEIAAMDFKPWDRNGACPVPTSDQFDQFKRIAPWLRIAWLYLTLPREDLADAIGEMDAPDLDTLEGVLRTTKENCQAIADMCACAESRMMIAYAVLTLRSESAGGEV